MILVNGDSFTAGEESSVAWPSLLPMTLNIAESGASNDYIVRSTVEYIESNTVHYAIIAWTTPHRIELGYHHLTPTSQSKYGPICTQVFSRWDDNWAVSKFKSQQAMLHGYLYKKGIPHIFVRTFDVPEIDKHYWVPGSIVEWMGDCPKGPNGHPLELGHQRIAEKINEYIRNLGWIS